MTILARRSENFRAGGTKVHAARGHFSAGRKYSVCGIARPQFTSLRDMLGVDEEVSCHRCLIILNLNRPPIQYDCGDTLSDMSPHQKLMTDLFSPLITKIQDWEPYLEEIKGVPLEQMVDRVMSTNKLPERARKVIILRFGLQDGGSMTYEEVARVFGVTRERIRQIEGKGLRTLRHPRSASSRSLKPYVYKPTKEDRKYFEKRLELYDKLVEYYPRNISADIAKAMRRRHLDRALISITGGDKSALKQALAAGCVLPMSRCLNCGNITFPTWDFCDKECRRDYKLVDVICDGCGISFKRPERMLIRSIDVVGAQHCFCTRPCMGQWRRGRPLKRREKVYEPSNL